MMTAHCTASGSVFVRAASGWTDDSNHFGNCATSTICDKFYYGTGHGFETKESGESSCLKCL